MSEMRNELKVQETSFDLMRFDELSLAFIYESKRWIFARIFENNQRLLLFTAPSIGNFVLNHTSPLKLKFFESKSSLSRQSFALHLF
jgi:hypothetical protein